MLKKISNLIVHFLASGFLIHHSTIIGVLCAVWVYFGAEVEEDGIFLRLASGNRNLRADRILADFEEKFGLEWFIGDIRRLEQYADGKPVCELMKK